MDELSTVEGLIQISGTTGGSINISDVMVQVYQTQKAILRKIQWRDLEGLQYPVLSDSENNRAVFANDIRYALRNTFGNKYQKFTSLFNIDRRKVGGETLNIYRLNCHQIDFLSSLRLRSIDQTKQMIAIRAMEGDAKKTARNEFRETLVRESQVWKDWSLSAQIEYSPSISAIEITYDPQALNVELTSVDKYSLDPQNYHQHLSTTSELMRYIASWARLSVAFVGDIEWATKDIRLMKLLVSVMDKEPIDFGRILINADDFEEWDYLNPKFEAETIG